MICMRSFRLFLTNVIADAGFLMPQIKAVIMNSLAIDKIKLIFYTFFPEDLFKFLSFKHKAHME